MSDLEETLAFHIKVAGMPEPTREYAFWPGRKFRFDFCWPALMLAVECEGGTRQGGRHNRHEGFEADCVKYAEALILGWRVLRVTSDMVKDGRAITLIERLMQVSGVSGSPAPYQDRKNSASDTIRPKISDPSTSYRSRKSGVDSTSRPRRRVPRG